MANAYITLSNSDASLTKLFRVEVSGYHPTKIKESRIDTTVDGTIDYQVGPVQSRWIFTLRVYETDPTDPGKTDLDTAGYGLLEHIIEFHGYNDPAATPSNVISFTEHDGTLHSTCYLVGPLTVTALGPQVTGIGAVFNVPITIVKAD